MSEKHLHEVVDEIKYLIDQGKANDALPLTHLLLSHYPRYIQGYQLLAEIALEEGSTADAIEVLQRILSADPESFVAHAGLAVAFKNQEQTEDALWHIQRAFEMEPRLREVREEVRQISQLHTGRRPGRLKLNGAALSRMYMREGTYDQAVKELKSELETQKNRVDLQVALAEAEWFAQRHEDAVRTSRQVLQELPLCLKINLILGQFYAQQEDFGSAERFLHVVQQLDPANELSAAWFGKAGYLQARDVIIPLNDDGSQNGNKAKMPRWLSNLSLFAAHDTEAQQESPAVTSIDDSFEFGLESGSVDANPINDDDEADASPVISIDSDFDFDVSAEPATDSTETLEPEPASDWAEQSGTDRDLIEPHFIEEPLEPPPSARRASSPPPSPPVKAKWRDALRVETEAALNQLPTLQQPSTAANMTSPADWLARLRAQTEAALLEHQIQESRDDPSAALRASFSRLEPPKTTTKQKDDLMPSQAEWKEGLASATHAALADFDVEQEARAQSIPEPIHITDQVIEWKEKLSAATHAGLVERETKQLMDVAEPTFEPFVDAPAEMDWRHGLIAATHAALADYEAAQSEDVTPVDSVGTLEWRQQLRSATHAALADADAHHQAAQSEEETAANVVDRLDSPEDVTSVTDTALAEREGLLGASIVGAVGAAVAASALPSEETAPSVVDESAHAAWKDALKVETDAHLASWTAPSALESPPIEVETAIDQVPTPVTSLVDFDVDVDDKNEPVGWLQPPPLQQTEKMKAAPKARRRLGKRWIEGLRFDTEVWLTTMRRTQLESELELEKPVVEPPSAPIWAEEELSITPPPLEMTPEPVLALTEETTVEAEQPELTTLPSKIEPEEAVRPWVTSLRVQTEEELAAEPTWIGPLHQASQAELAALSTSPATWVAGLRAETDTQLAETISVVAKVESETAPDADIETQSTILSGKGSDDFSRSEVDEETPEVVTTQEVGEGSGSDDFSRSDLTSLQETTSVVTTPEVDEETPEVVTTQEIGEGSGSDDFSRSDLTSLQKTTQVVTTPEVGDTTPEVGEGSGSDDFSRSDLTSLQETTSVVTTPKVEEETTEVVTTPEVDQETTQVVTTPEVDESSELVTDVASETGHLSPSYTNGTVTSEPILPDRWQVARQAWQVGKHQDAYAIYQSFFSESDEYDAQLDDALSAWTRIDDAPFLAFQLLGDVYRRMRRMQDAVKQYREAIKRI